MTVSGLNILRLSLGPVLAARCSSIAASPAQEKEQDDDAPDKNQVVKDGFRTVTPGHREKGPTEQDKTEKKKEQRKPRFVR